MRRVVIVFALLLLLATTAYGAETAVTSLDTDVLVEQDGACTVVLTASIHFAEGTEGFVIPIPASAKQVQMTGATFRSKRSDDLLLLTLEGTLSGTHNVTVSYRLVETVTDRGDTQDFSVRLLCPAWTCAIQAYKFRVQLPGSFDTLPTIVSGYYGDLIDNYMDVQIHDGVIEAVLNETRQLQDHEAMSLSLTLPRGFFDLRFLAGKTVAAARVFFLLLTAATLGFWLVFLRGKLLLPRRQAMPPVGSNAGELPYILTGQGGELPLMIVQWASLGYLTISRNRKGRILLRRRMEMQSERRRYEAELFRGLFARGDVCDTHSGEYLRTRAEAPGKVKEYWFRKLFAGKGNNPWVLRTLAAAAALALCLGCADACVAPRSWRWFLILPLSMVGALAACALQFVGGCFLRRQALRTLCLAGAGLVYLLVLGRIGAQSRMMLLCVVFQLLVGFALRCGPRRTRTGVIQATELLGLRRYLLTGSAKTFRANLDSDPQFFYQMLPYADALQVSRAFAADFRNRELEPCDWLDWEGREPRTALAFLARYERLMAVLRGERPPVLRSPAARTGRRPR